MERPFRNSRGQEVPLRSVSATEAKNEFGGVLETAISGRPVVIKKRDEPKAVVLSIDDFNALVTAGERTLETLSDEFDAAFARMQGARAREAAQTAFDASPSVVGRASVRAARKRG